MMYFLLSITTTLSMIFLFTNHPLSMGLILFLQTITLCLICGLMSPSFWFSYILLLIYLGGMLVLFMYITSLASNELFHFSNKILLFICLTPLMFSYIYFNKPCYSINYYESLENNMLIFNSIPNNFLLKMYNQPMNMITILIASYLFLTLIAVVKIINIFKGPLRHLN